MVNILQTTFLIEWKGDVFLSKLKKFVQMGPIDKSAALI